MPAKKQFAAKLREDQNINDPFVVLHKQISPSRAGRNYLRVTLGDKSGKIEARVWEGADELAARFNLGDLVYVTGVVTSYQGVLQLKATYIERIEESELATINWGDFLPAAQRPVGEMWAELTALLDTVEDGDLKRLIALFTDDEEFASRFKTAPAAKGMHHAYIGGLLEHTLSAVSLADRIAPLYNLNRDILVTGAFLHDIGKLDELSSKAGFDYTTEGRLVGHIVQGVVMLRQKTAGLENFPQELLLHLEHMIVSHHGELEWGAPKQPMTLEALALHSIDNMDAKMAAVDQAQREKAGPLADWTGFIRQFDRSFYTGFGSQELSEQPQTSAGTNKSKKKNEEESGGESGQGMLF